MEEYSKQILESFEKNISPLIDKLENVELTEENSYITQIHKKLEELNDILKKAEIKTLKINSLCNQLLPLYYKNIPALHTLLDTYHYLDKIDPIIEKMKEGKPLSTKEESYVFFYTKKSINHKNSNLIFDYAILHTQTSKPNISFFLFKSLFISQVKISIPNKELRVMPLKKDVGKCYEKFMVVEERHLQELYEGKNLGPIITLYHEMRHMYQKKEIKNPSNIYSLTMLKEYILITHLDGYYKENYDKTLAEIDANYFGIICFEAYCKQIGIPIIQSIAFLEQEKKRLIANYQNEERTYKKVKTSLHTLLESFLKENPHILEIYPSLSIVYKRKEGTIMRKTFEELVQDAQNIKQKGLTKEEIETKKALYKEILLNEIDKEEKKAKQFKS